MTIKHMQKWSPAGYLKFEKERNQPSIDLLAMVPLTDPKSIVDLGCGPGNSTALLAARYPNATIVGIDSSIEMLEAARKRLPQVHFMQTDISEWLPKDSIDLLFANAVFQWIPNHLDVLSRLLIALPSGAVLAVQVPDNLDEPSHALMRKLASSDKWKAIFQQPIKRESILSPAEYYNRLKPLCGRLEIWHTYYLHPLEGPAAIVEMLKSTGLGPYLQQLPKNMHAAFLTEYESEIAQAYPRLIDGAVLLRFPRLFIVAVRNC